MKYFVHEIVNQILRNVNNIQTSVIRLDYMPHPRVYLEVCEKLNQEFESNGTTFVARLSKEKYSDFESNPYFVPELKQLENAGLVDNEGRMTHYRNTVADKAGVILLMGTEAVDDRGGLADFYAITPTVLENLLKNKYSTWVGGFILDYNDLWQENLNVFLTKLFKYVPVDLLKLSNIFEEMSKQGSIKSSELLEILSDRLFKDWNLPRIAGQHNLQTRLKLMEKAHKFKERTDYKDGLSASQLTKILKKFDAFIEKHPEIEEDCDNQYKIVFSSYDDFKQSIVEYTSGINLKQNRMLLFECDFTLMNSILNISVGGNKTKTTPKIYGAPLEVILKTMLQINQQVASTGESVRELIYEIKDVQIAGCSSEEELISSWLNICNWSGGIMDFISCETWKTEEQDLAIRWSHEFDPFKPVEARKLVREGFIKKAAASKKLCKIEFDITVVPSNQNYSFIWEFEPLNSWSQAFMLLSGNLNEKVNGSTFIPFGVCNKIADITQLTNEDDFLAVLENVPIEFVDLFEVISHRLPSDGDVIGHAFEIAKSFVLFIDDILTNGFYKTFDDATGSGISLVSYYQKVIDYLGKTNFSAMVEQQLHLLANAFLITHNLNEGVEHKAVASVIVPPFHPAMLEKMQAQAQFIRQGALEIFEQLESGIKVKVDYEFEKLLQLSTITSAVDVLIGPGEKCLPVKNTFAYHCLYHNDSEAETILSTLGSSNYDVVSDDGSSITELRKATPLSKLFSRQVKEYLNTYPFQSDELKLLFINPPDLQPVVSGVHQVVQELKKSLPKVRVKLHVLLPSFLKGGRGYLRYWLDNFFSEEDDVDIETFCTNLDLNKVNHGGYLQNLFVDIAFVENPLETSVTKFEPMNQFKLPISECRFPMVYPPLPISKTSVQRLMSASQTQFRAAHLHTQLVRKIINKHLKDDNYRLVKEMTLNKQWETLMNLIHEQSHWVVCIDSGIDKEIMHGSNNRIISFSTGEGPFGEYNFTVSTNQTVQIDIAHRLKAQLKRKFPAWPNDSLEDVANNCLQQSKSLDGIRLLRALNPNDYEMHNFLAYILTAQEFNLTGAPHPDYAIRTLVSLDNYDHWFDNGGFGSKQPDFLLLEIPKGDELLINATLVECKMGAYSESHTSNAYTQLVAGHRLLSNRWNQLKAGVDKRYWFAQLYRVLVFSKINLEDNSSEYEAFVRSLNNILDGEFSIRWNAKLFGFWLDGHYERLNVENFIAEDGLEVVYYPFGQLYIQKMLRTPEHREQPVQFLTPVTEETQDKMDGDMDDYQSENDEEIPTEIQKVDLSQFAIDVSNEVASETLKDEEVTFNTKTEGSKGLQEKGSNSESVTVIESKITEESIQIKTETTSENNANTEPDHITMHKLDEVRVLIGEDMKTKEKVYWEYGHPQLPNRHILISGNSGTGKTYLIQTMMLELARAGVSCMVFDYTDGFTESKLEPEFRDVLKNKIIEFPVYHVPFPINPFKRYDIEIAGNVFPQKNVDVAERIKSLFQAVYAFGDQQASAIYKATRNGLEKYGDKMNLNNLQSELQEIASEIPNAKTVLSKIEPLVDREPFNCNEVQDWSKIKEGRGTIFIVQLSGFTRDVQLIITEMILWDAWYYNVKNGDKNLPFPVILDEAQNLDHGSRSPSTMILTEGRKFGWSGWFATQFMKNQLKVDEIQRLQQASQKIYFSPPEAEIADIVANIETDKALRSAWNTRMAQLRKGECVVVGYEVRNGKLEKRPPRVVKVSSFEERINDYEH